MAAANASRKLGLKCLIALKPAPNCPYTAGQEMPWVCRADGSATLARCRYLGSSSDRAAGGSQLPGAARDDLAEPSKIPRRVLRGPPTGYLAHPPARRLRLKIDSAADDLGGEPMAVVRIGGSFIPPISSGPVRAASPVTVTMPSRVIRTSNAYVFNEPPPCAKGPPASKVENPTRTLNQEVFSVLPSESVPARDPNSPFERPCGRLAQRSEQVWH